MLTGTLGISRTKCRRSVRAAVTVTMALTMTACGLGVVRSPDHAPEPSKHAGSWSHPKHPHHRKGKVPEMPEVEGPVPYTELGDIYIDPLEANFAVSAEDRGYVFEEFFLSGTAAGEPYKVRVMVTRPGEDAEVTFSGNAIVEAKHGTGIPFVWNFTRDYLMAQGHAAVEISIFPNTVEGHLKGHDAERYGDLQVAEDVADAEVEAAGAADIYAQVGLALKSDLGMLPGLERTYMTGHSMAVGPVWHYMDTHHKKYRLPGGAPIYDAFFPETTRTASSKGPFPKVDVPTLLLNSELEVEAVIVESGINYRRPDSDKRGKQFRLYEVAGLPHNPSWMHPLLQAAVTEQAAETCENPQLNSFPYQGAVSMGLDQLIRWVQDGVSPPRAKPIALTGDPDDPDAEVQVKRDEHGNALGGVRSTTLDVPVATHTGVNSTEPLLAGDCLVYGSQIDFSAETLQDLYGDHATYVKQLNDRLDELIAEGWWLEMFADDLRTQAEEFDGFE